MLLFDLDRFKEINDRFGHAVGDQVLQTFAQAATATLGADVLFGRIGGEEFAALMPVGDLGEAIAVADRVRRNFADAAARFADDELAPTVSVGVTLGLDAKAEVEVCWRSPTRRSIAPRRTAATGSKRPRRRRAARGRPPRAVDRALIGRTWRRRVAEPSVRRRAVRNVPGCSVSTLSRRTIAEWCTKNATQRLRRVRRRHARRIRSAPRSFSGFSTKSRDQRKLRKRCSRVPAPRRRSLYMDEVHTKS